MRKDSWQSRPFLGGEYATSEGLASPIHEVEDPSCNNSSYHHTKLSGLFCGRTCLIIATVINLLMFTWTISWNGACIQKQEILLPLPARNALLWKLRHFESGTKDNPFQGKPRAELDTAWHNLLRNDNIKISKNSLKALNLTSVYLKNGEDGIASLGVFHSLHCLKRVRHMIYRNYYHQGKSNDSMAHEMNHVDHCIDYIRESLMCKPDISLSTYRWINETSQLPDPAALGPTSFDKCPHECADWSVLDKWAENRAVNLWDGTLLQEPENGLRYKTPYGD